MKEWRFKPDTIDENESDNDILIDLFLYFAVISYLVMVLIPLYLWIELLIKYHSFDWILKP